MHKNFRLHLDDTVRLFRRNGKKIANFFNCKKNNQIENNPGGGGPAIKETFVPLVLKDSQTVVDAEKPNKNRISFAKDLNIERVSECEFQNVVVTNNCQIDSFFDSSPPKFTTSQNFTLTKLNADMSDEFLNLPELQQSETPVPVSKPSIIMDSQPETVITNIEQRYGGQCFTAEQLPAFCEQLSHLVEMIRNIESYNKLTGEYPSALEKRLDREAREVGALLDEVRNARESLQRTRTQRRALLDHRAEVIDTIVALRREEVVELESIVRSSDRALFKSWEGVREAIDVEELDQLTNEVKMKENALQCLTRLIDNRRCTLKLLLSSNSTLSTRAALSNVDKHPRYRRRPFKRKKKDKDVPSHSTPLSSENSRHSAANSKVTPNLFTFSADVSVSSSANQSNNTTIGSVNSNQSRRSSLNINPMTVPYELISQSGIPANMLPSLGSNSNHNLSMNVGSVNPMLPLRFNVATAGTGPHLRITTSDGDQANNVVFVRIEDQ